LKQTTGCQCNSVDALLLALNKSHCGSTSHVKREHLAARRKFTLVAVKRKVYPTKHIKMHISMYQCPK
jgi:hypothetical protein